MESHFLWHHFDGQKIASGKHAEENTKDKEKMRIVIMKDFIWKKKKTEKRSLFPSDPAPITNILSSFTDLKVQGSWQLSNFTASPPFYMFKKVVVHMQQGMKLKEFYS